MHRAQKKKWKLNNQERKRRGWQKEDLGDITRIFNKDLYSRPLLACAVYFARRYKGEKLVLVRELQSSVADFLCGATWFVAERAFRGSAALVA